MAKEMDHIGVATEQRARWIAAFSTLIFAIIIMVIMMCTHLSLSKIETPDSHKSQIELEEYIDIMEMPSSPAMTNDAPSSALAEEQMQSQPTPASGTDLEDAGAAADTPPIVANKEESPVKVVKKEDPKPSGPEVDKKKKEEEEIKRQAKNEIANAFNRAAGQHNNSSGAVDQGNNGTPNGNSPQGVLNGTGKGVAGGGWSIPAYGAVQSTVTGSVKMVVTIDREGNVTNLRFDGGDAPAATNNAVRQACAAEVRKRKFTRSNYDDAPETSTAYITYTFK